MTSPRKTESVVVRRTSPATSALGPSATARAASSSASRARADQARSEADVQIRSQAAGVNAVRFELVYPDDDSRVGDDVEVALLMPFPLARSSHETVRPQRAILNVGSEVNVRPLTSASGCSVGETSAKEEVGACSTAGEANSQAFRWIVRAKEAGSSIAVVKLPDGWRDHMPGAWEAHLSTNGTTWTRIVRPDGRAWVPGSNRGGIREVPIVLGPAHPRDGFRDYNVDLRDGYVQFPLSLSTTLGMTAQTYSVFAALGATLSAVMGTDGCGSY